MNFFRLDEDVLLQRYITKRISEILDSIPFSKQPIGIAAKNLDIDPKTPGLRTAMKTMAAIFAQAGWITTYGVNDVYGYMILFRYPLPGYGLSPN